MVLFVLAVFAQKERVDVAQNQNVMDHFNVELIIVLSENLG